MAATQDREVALANHVSMFAMGMLAQEEGYDPNDQGACVDALVRRGDEITRFTEICLPLLEEIDQRDLDSAATERLTVEAVATAWQKLQQEVG